MLPPQQPHRRSQRNQSRYTCHWFGRRRSPRDNSDPHSSARCRRPASDSRLRRRKLDMLVYSHRPYPGPLGPHPHSNCTCCTHFGPAGSNRLPSDSPHRFGTAVLAPALVSVRASPSQPYRRRHYRCLHSQARCHRCCHPTGPLWFHPQRGKRRCRLRLPTTGPLRRDIRCGRSRENSHCNLWLVGFPGHRGTGPLGAGGRFEQATLERYVVAPNNRGICSLFQTSHRRFRRSRLSLLPPHRTAYRLLMKSYRQTVPNTGRATRNRRSLHHDLPLL